jgi:tetratricopeptide (TPR) repeat protein
VYWLDVQEDVYGYQESHAAVLAELSDGSYHIVDASLMPASLREVPQEYLAAGEVKKHLEEKSVLVRELDPQSSSLHHIIRILAFETGAQANIYNNLGKKLDDQGRYEQAVAVLRKAVAVNPKCLAAWNNLGNALDRLGKYEEAIKAFQEALNNNRQYALAWFNMGNTFIRMRRYKDAIISYQNAVKFNTQYADAWYNLGITFYNLNRYEKAITSYQNAVKINPQHELAWYNIVFMLRVSGNKDASKIAEICHNRIENGEKLSKEEVQKAFDEINAARHSLMVSELYSNVEYMLKVADIGLKVPAVNEAKSIIGLFKDNVITKLPIAIFVAEDLAQLKQISFEKNRYLPVVVTKLKDEEDHGLENTGITLSGKPVWQKKQDGILYVFIEAEKDDFAYDASQVALSLQKCGNIKPNPRMLRFLKKAVNTDCSGEVVVFDYTGGELKDSIDYTPVVLGKNISIAFGVLKNLENTRKKMKTPDTRESLIPAADPRTIKTIFEAA